MFKDYCGVLSEEAVRKNFILLYELLDEMMDFGYPQITSTEMLKESTQNEPIAVTPIKATPSFRMPLSMAPRTMPSTASNKPVLINGNDLNSKNSNNPKAPANDIYVDILERVHVLFNPEGFMINSAIDGSIVMKSYLHGNPELKLALNEDLVVGRGIAGMNSSSSSGGVVLDDCNFHECAKLDDFDSSRCLSFIPPSGEFALLNYRITADFKAPFRVNATVEESSTDPNKIDFTCSAKAEIPPSNHSTNVVLRIPVPKSTVSASVEFSKLLNGCHAEYNAAEKQIVWTIRKFPGGQEMNLKAKLTLDGPVTMARKREVGPVSLNFEIPMFSVSNLQVRYLRIADPNKTVSPYRWVRYVTQSSSYVCRLRY